eukprot:symbB.v1.2.030666.t3/scaffold3482.1/size55780/4
MASCKAWKRLAVSALPRAGSRASFLLETQISEGLGLSLTTLAERTDFDAAVEIYHFDFNGFGPSKTKLLEEIVYAIRRSGKESIGERLADREELRLVGEDLKDYPGLPRLTYYDGVLRYELAMELREGGKGSVKEQQKLAKEAIKILKRRSRDPGQKKGQEEEQQRSAAAYFCARAYLDLLEEATQAEKWFEASIKLEMDFLYAHVALIQMLFQAKRYQEAFDKAIRAQGIGRPQLRLFMEPWHGERSLQTKSETEKSRQRFPVMFRPFHCDSGPLYVCDIPLLLSKAIYYGYSDPTIRPTILKSSAWQQRDVLLKGCESNCPTAGATASRKMHDIGKLQEFWTNENASCDSSVAEYGMFVMEHKLLQAIRSQNSKTGCLQLVGAVPMYLKMHSEGEFCEEMEWIEASLKHRTSHWPRLFVGIPFTPHRGRRLITAAWLSAAEREEVEKELVRCLQAISVRANVGVNIAFPTEAEGTTLTKHGFIERLARQACPAAWLRAVNMPERQGHQRTEDVVIFEGTFSWWAAWCMMIWVLCFLASTVLMILSTRGSAFQIISEEISYVKEVRPPYGPEEQPVADATMREINQMFAYRLPQTALFYSLAGSSLGLFTVSYFTSFVLLEDQGPKRVVDIGFLISKGVNVYMGRTIPVILALLFLGGWYVFTTAGPRAVACFAVGAVLNLISAQVGVSVTVQGQTRLAHALSLELFDSLQIGIRTGSIGGLLATSLALGGMAGMWLLIQDTLALSGFGSGASIAA